jgi:hypothetical protein
MPLSPRVSMNLAIMLRRVLKRPQNSLTLRPLRRRSALTRSATWVRAMNRGQPNCQGSGWMLARCIQNMPGQVFDLGVAHELAGRQGLPEGRIAKLSLSEPLCFR